MNKTSFRTAVRDAKARGMSTSDAIADAVRRRRTSDAAPKSFRSAVRDAVGKGLSATDALKEAVAGFRAR